MVLASIFDLTSACRKTNGAIPPKLVGASTTVIGSHMYLFGGRQVAERKMASDLYCFDLETLVWTKLPNHPDDDLPCPRYFHSSDSWGNLLIIFGGMSNQPDSPNPDELCVLNDVRLYDIEAGRWLPSTPDGSGEAPRARYAHLSSVTADRLFIIGGQDFFNTWLDDVCVYDLLARTWVQRRDYPRHCGTYRSVAVSSNLTVRHPTPQNHPRFSSPASDDSENTAPESLVFHPYSAPPTEDHPADIYLYSNYNFTDVKRELEVFSPLPDTDFTITDRSGSMAGTTFPPGLRFPTGAILGNHLIIAGTYLAHSYQSFSIWVLDLQTMHWSRIDPGKAVESGSWFRGCLAPYSNRFYIFGNRDGNLVDDYNRRLLSWEHVAVVDLEAFGIYQPPPARVDISMQELGLTALEEGILADFEVVCEDGRKVPCSRKLLEERWPWFRDQRRMLLESALHAMESMPTSPMHVDLPSTYKGADPRLTPRALHLSEPYPITLALVQYFYAQALITPLQQAPAVLSQLLVLATTYNIEHLEELVRHAMHRALSNSTSVGVYEVATLCNCRSLQIRALKTVMSYTQKRSGNSKPKDGRGPPPPPSNSDPNTNGGSESYSRPRGTSDAKWRTMGGGGDSTGTYSSKFVI
ncbi:galactose oxidase [Mucidula mucida]|nr:galactose oxidase [Mucidula mucida]